MMGALQFSTYDYLFLKHRSVVVKLLDIADEYYPSLKKATVHQMATENKFPFPVFKLDQKSRTAPYFVNLRDLADALDKEHQKPANNIDQFIQSGEFDNAFRDVFGLPIGVVKSLGEVS